MYNPQQEGGDITRGLGFEEGIKDECVLIKGLVDESSIALIDYGSRFSQPTKTPMRESQL